jgi:hypothetical protein
LRDWDAAVTCQDEQEDALSGYAKKKAKTGNQTDGAYDRGTRGPLRAEHGTKTAIQTKQHKLARQPLRFSSQSAPCLFSLGALRLWGAAVRLGQGMELVDRLN